MLYNSGDFALFLPLAVLLIFISARFWGGQVTRYAAIAISLIFFSFAGKTSFIVFSISILGNWLFANSLWRFQKRASKQNLCFYLALIFNLGLLGYFKYADFVLSNLTWALGEHHPLNLILPLGISFFTLQQVGFLVDVKQGMVAPIKLLDYLNFVAFFPQMTAGPIVRLGEVLPQYQNNFLGSWEKEKVFSGILQFLTGLVKKVVIADNLGSFYSQLIPSTQSLPQSPWIHWLASTAFALQVYFDFSGYSDMAIGSAALFGLKLPENFVSPFQAKNLIDFWGRWHITLSRFLNTYIYIPLLKSRSKVTLSWNSLAVTVTMLVSGLWHGASWTFVVFGILHGLVLALNYIWRKKKFWFYKPLGTPLTFLFFVVTMVFFNSPTLKVAFGRLAIMFNILQGQFEGAHLGMMIFILISMAIVFLASNSQVFVKWLCRQSAVTAGAVVTLLVYTIIILGKLDNRTYVYFNF